jgi:hypothetical protein
VRGVFKLFNVGSFYVAATAKGEIEIVINWLFPQWAVGHQILFNQNFRTTE